MHDVLEGVFPRDIAKVLSFYIRDLKLFTLEDLNHRIKDFRYGPNDSRSKHTQIMERHLKDIHLSMSASEC